eukprot:TRINITY_DN141970_c0_g1_i1.p1 TRINITY_DN141970_c0_g1~~TRINITY_DN141970_c0_g1_i1.p1  ORF type:complete len:355 (-),score=38.81 TRINITY_DN141970_c0_g1_i1:27-1091(-)
MSPPPKPMVVCRYFNHRAGSSINCHEERVWKHGQFPSETFLIRCAGEQRSNDPSHHGLSKGYGSGNGNGNGREYGHPLKKTQSQKCGHPMGGHPMSADPMISTENQGTTMTCHTPLPTLQYDRKEGWKDSLGRRTKLHEDIGIDDAEEEIKEREGSDSGYICPEERDGGFSILLPSKAWTCHLCTMRGEYDTIRRLVNHLQEKHKITEVVFRCRKCGRSGERHGIAIHAAKCKGHTCCPVPDSHPHRCEICPMSFTTTSGLGQHIRHQHPVLANQKRIDAPRVEQEKKRVRRDKEKSQAQEAVGAKKLMGKTRLWDTESTKALITILSKVGQEWGHLEKVRVGLQALGLSLIHI